MSLLDTASAFLARLKGRTPQVAPSSDPRQRPPVYSTAPRPPSSLPLLPPEQSVDGVTGRRLHQYPPPEKWDDWVEWDAKAWPRKVPRHYTLVPTACFNCESACGLMAYVDKQTYEVRKFEGNPAHPGSRGRNCAKGPATHNQTYDPERILYPLKRVGQRGEGRWTRISWDQALAEISQKMRQSRARRRDGIAYHVGRPGEDHFANRTVQAWGVDGHNSHTNICSAAARAGYAFWTACDRPSPDYANARAILLISAHLESGHYFNPHAQRIIEAKMKGGKIITLDPRLSNTAAKSDVWLPSWPGSEAWILLAIARHLLVSDSWDRAFVRRWVNWEEFLEVAHTVVEGEQAQALAQRIAKRTRKRFEDFEALLLALYDEFTFERAAAESQVPIERIREAAEIIAGCGGKLAAHTWRSATMGNRGGWQVARCLMFLNVLTGSLGATGGTAMNKWNKFVPRPFSSPPALDAWNELHLPHEWPFAMYEMSFLLPHFLEEGRGDIDVYFTRVYNPMWINPDGFMWLKALEDEERIRCHVALTPTWNESAWFADYVLPMGHAGERHDIQSQETHDGQWFAFRQPVRRVAMERAGRKIRFTYEANPGEVWEEAEFWIQLSGAMDPDGSLGIRKWFESPYRPGELVTVEEYFRWIFENAVPGLPERARAEGLTPLAWMRKYGAYEVKRHIGRPFEEVIKPPEGYTIDADGRIRSAEGDGVGVLVGGKPRAGFGTPSGRLEFYSSTLAAWGWPEQQHVIPWVLKSHVHPDEIDRAAGEMLLLPTFRLPTLIHTRSANAKWLYEISHNNPVWMHPQDATRLGVQTGDLVRVDTEIGHFVDKVRVTEAIKPGIIAMSHHLGRWRLAPPREPGQPEPGQPEPGQNGQASLGAVGGIARGMANTVELSSSAGQGPTRQLGQNQLTVTQGAGPWTSTDPDTARIWWRDVGVHQNLTHAVHPDPISGAHCWHQKALSVRKAKPHERHGDVQVDTTKSMEVYRQWHALARSAVDHSPDGTRRPRWLKRPLKPTPKGYQLPEKPFGR